MLIDFDIQRCTRRCAATERELLPGEEYFSVLMPGDLATNREGVERADYSLPAWTGPPAEALGWWKSRLPNGKNGKPKLAPNEVLLALFDQWAEEPERVEARYVLALLLVRRRIFRLEEGVSFDAAPQAQDAGLKLMSEEATEDPSTESDEPQEKLHLYCPKQDTWRETQVADPSAERSQAIQAELLELLY